MPDKWNISEEKQLIKEIANDKKIEYIAKKHNRSVNAINLRIKKIIYDNINNDYNETKEKKLASLFKLPKETIKKYYYEYKGFIEKKEETKTKTNKQPLPKKSKTKSNQIVKIQEQNVKLKTIIDNIVLKEQITGLIKKKKLDPKIIDFIK